MRELFKLVGEVTIAGVELVSKQLDGIEKKVTTLVKPIDKLGKQIETVGKRFTTMMAPVAALGAGIGFLAIKTGEYSEKLLNLSKVSGLSTQTLQELQHVAKISGVSFEGLINAITTFTRKLPEIIKEGGNVSKAIKSLGVNVYDSSGNIRDMNVLFPNMIKKLQLVDNVTTRNSLATQIFGKSLTDIAPILAMTSEEFDAMRQEANDLGLVLGEDAINAADNFGDEVDKLKSQISFLGMKLAGDFIPIFRDSILPLIKTKVVPAIQEFAEKIKSIITWFRNLSPETKDFILKFAAFAAIIGPTLIVMGKFIGLLKTVTSTIFLMKAAIIGLNTVMLTNPFFLAAAGIMAMTGAIILATKEYKNLRKEHESFTKVVTVEQARADALIIGFEKLREAVGKHGKELKDTDTMQLLFGKDIDDLTAKAKELGYTVNGDVIERFKRLNDISNGVKNSVFSLNGELVKTSKTQKEVTKDVINLSKEVKEKDIVKFYAEGLIRLNEEQIKNTDNFIEQYNIKKNIIENQKMLEINAAKKANEDTSIIEAVYVQKYIELENWKAKTSKDINDKANEEKKKIRAQEIADIKKLNDEKIAIDKKYAELTADTYQKQLELLRTQRDEEIRNAETTGAAVYKIKAYYADQELKLVLDKVGQQISMWGDAVMQIIALTQMATQNKLAELDNQYAKEKSVIDKSTMNEKQKQDAYQKLDKKTDAEKRKLQKEAAKREKAAAIFGAIINTALAITSAIATVKPLWLGIVMAIVAGALGTAQVAMIAAQPLPMAKGGLIKGGLGGIQAEIGEGNQNELVLPMKTGVQILADSLLEKLKSAVLPPTSQSQFALAGGGMSSGSMSSKNETHYHIGTLIGDDNSLKELERRMLPYRVSEEHRKGN